MAIVTEDIYRSANGDRWKLVRDTATGRALVRHEANVASGGNVLETEVEDFLHIEGPGPESLRCGVCWIGPRDPAVPTKESSRTAAPEGGPASGTLALHRWWDHFQVS